MLKSWKRILLIAFAVIALVFGCALFASCEEEDQKSSYGWETNAAYAVAQAAGYNGTVDEFFSILKKIGVEEAQAQSFAVNESGELILVFSDGNTANFGSVARAIGKQWLQYADVESVALDENGDVLVTLSDGTKIKGGVLPVCEHVYSDWTTEREASCTSMGSRKRTCTVCGNTEYEFTEATGHAYGNWSTLLSTCEAFWQTRACSYCGDKQTVSLSPVLSHSYVGEQCKWCEKRQFVSGGDGDSNDNSDNQTGNGSSVETVPTQGLSYVLNADGKSYSVTGMGAATATHIVVGGKYNGLPVTAVESFAFRGEKGIVSLTVGSNVTSLGEEAFYACGNLKSVTLGDDVTSIGNGAFSKCVGITRITFGNAVQTVGDLAFYCCGGITDIILPESVISVGTMAFYSCENLKTVTFQGSWAEWETVLKGDNWDKLTGNYTIVCVGEDET